MSDSSHEHEILKKTTARQTGAAPDPVPDVNPLNRLQRMIGNRAVQRLITPNGTTIQTKMTVTAANDAYEHEADAVADQVVRKINAPQVQRDHGEDELQMKRVQRGSEGEEEESMALKRIQRESEGGESEDEEMQLKRIQRESEGEEEESMALKRIQRESEGEEEESMALKRIQRESEGEEEESMALKRIQRESEGGESEDEEMQLKRVQRESEGEEEESMALKRVQRAAGGADMMGSFDVGDDFEKELSSARGGGKPLDGPVAEKMGSAIGADFSGVRVHEGSQADSLNNAVQAKAFTTGSDIFFKSGEYNPSSTDGQKLLAHELTHTVQQGAVSAKRDERKG